MRARSGFALLAIAALTSGCREAPEPFVPPDLEPPTESTWRLTFNPGDDRAPTWSPDGARIIYSAEGFEDRLGEPGLLASVPFEGGIADIVFPDLQVDTGPVRWFTAPSVASNPDRVAFAQLIRLFGETLCGATVLVDCGTTQFGSLPQPRLATVAVRVRQVEAPDGLTADPTYEINFAGRLFDGTQHPSGLPGVYLIDHYPFHQIYSEDSTLVFRPSWAPDGTRLAVSDGLQLLIWDVDGGSVSPIAGTADGVTAAWSPTGEWIAFTRLERADSTGAFCEHIVGGTEGPVLTCVEQRRSFTLGPRILTLVRPDGSERRELGEGEEAAWSPDGLRLFFRRDGQIWVRGLNPGDAAVPVPGTDGGREPAIAPDGRHLAFARRGGDGRLSIWIAGIEP